VVAYLTDKESGAEIARGTFQPYTNKEGNHMYRLDSYYGENNAQFKKYLKQLEGELSQPHTGSPAYNINPNVYNDSRIKKAITSSASTEDIANAIAQGDLSLSDIPEELRTPEVCKIAVAKNGKALEYVPEKMRTPEIYKLAVTQNGMALYYMPLEMRTPELCEIAVTQNGDALRLVPEKMRTPELYKLAVA
jgi:ABC-type oligopeptide transport system substrate-binding subunit